LREHYDQPSIDEPRRCVNPETCKLSGQFPSKFSSGSIDIAANILSVRKASLSVGQLISPPGLQAFQPDRVSVDVPFRTLSNVDLSLKILSFHVRNRDFGQLLQLGLTKEGFVNHLNFHWDT
jgi:hypothetical protein